jgi:hypothetical protein
MLAIDTIAVVKPVTSMQIKGAYSYFLEYVIFFISIALEFFWAFTFKPKGKKIDRIYISPVAGIEEMETFTGQIRALTGVQANKVSLEKLFKRSEVT